MRAAPLSFLVALLIAGPLLGGCSSSSDFDPTDMLGKLDFFNLNKEEKLKGERKPLFPEGVPGVSQGIPPDLVKGYKPPETAVVEEEPKEEKPKPKPQVVRRTPPKPATRIQVTPAQQQQQQQQPQPQQAQQQQQAPAWPDPKPQAQPQAQQQTGASSPWPAPQKQTSSPWPDAPPPNTFQR